MTEFIDGQPNRDVSVRATWLHRVARLDIPTELRVQLWNNEVTGTVTFLSQAKPPQRLSRLYGDAGSLEVDYDAQTVRFTPPSALPGAFEKLQRPLGHVSEACGNLARGVWNFACGDIHYFAGMHNLFAAFYDHIRDGGPPPIDLDEMVRVTAIMDAVFEAARVDESAPTGQPETANQSDKVAAFDEVPR